MEHKRPTETKKADTSSIVLLLPQPSRYADASITDLIFLAIESNPSLRTEAAIAKEISKLTKGAQTPSQSCVSKHLRPMKQRPIHARNGIWKIVKQDECYCLISQQSSKREEAANKLSAIPFDRSTVFRNSATSPTVFGFRFMPGIMPTPENIASAKDLFDNLLDGLYFHMHANDGVLYILLDYQDRHYASAVKMLNNFIQNNFLTKSRRYSVTIK